VSLLGQALGDPLVREALSEAGWVPEYRHDAAGWIELLRAEGFTVHAAGAEVLALLGGLRVPARRSARAVFGSGALLVDPLWAATGESSRIRSRESQLGTGLCPVGEWMDEYIVLAASDGSVLAETTFQVLQLGKDLSEAIVRIVTAESLPVPLIGRGNNPPSD
jgi:SUKH-3 immunity protein